MAGHSHSANIAHRKGLVDAKRGQLFTKLCRAVYVAARNGGGDPSANMRLRYAIDKARSFSVPKENIERSIKKATGELGAENFEEVVYEGYGPGGVAVLCEALTDNRNRTASELRRLFESAGGNLGASGCVGYLFNFKGLFVIDSKHVAEERLMEVVSRYRDQPLHIISNQVMLALDAWIGAEEQPDDITLVLARQV